MEILGSNNLILEPIVRQSEEELDDQTSGNEKQNRFSPGLRVSDAESFVEIIPGVNKVSPEIVLETSFLRKGRKRSGKLIGVTGAFFEHSSFKMDQGHIFNPNSGTLWILMP